MKRNHARNWVADNQDAVVPMFPKTAWHSLSLQQLEPGRFVEVVNRILDGRYELFEGSLRGASGIAYEELRDGCEIGLSDAITKTL